MQYIFLLYYLHELLFFTIYVLSEGVHLLAYQVHHLILTKKYFCVLLFQHAGDVLVSVGKNPNQLFVLSRQTAQHRLLKNTRHGVRLLGLVDLGRSAGLLERSNRRVSVIDYLANPKEFSAIDPGLG